MSTSVGARLPDWRDALLVVAAAVAVNLIGAVGVPFTATESAWFAGLDLPAYYPPSWAFGVVWPILYALIGAAAALVYLGGREGREGRADGSTRIARDARIALGLFGAQLAVNVAWSPVFWGLERADLGLVVLGLLLPLVVATIVAFDRVDRRAALLLVPYLAWVCFATALNYGIWALN
ncbi:TspO/MBR family protein [Halorubrum lacusprofundi]|jgi:tryptophan-rich sensory protein|uniref:TspO and MBR like protein n=1 Tax=Halorubrum lacusprofundi (strain ATCC 49239 / DSM 5036 / JCM 8891 / ACAM 34) TaxID=416348 RepID=B9LQA8_HALLT|nr:TspO/MBR family protein [Halorubrum lacusprofundi]ACM57529.1 TspO and MBR like protein [Halorubrum lacusprofundi ATCC 49239]MCG1005874.1 tryptophan-rich sensory protein [Halorubrum lacusprofundi]